jgi:hypothetical protein
MALPIPADWFGNPPTALVVGGGPYAAALAQVLRAGRLTAEDLGNSARAIESTSRVLDELERVFVVADASESPADVLRSYDALWRWVQLLTKAKKEHRLAVLFVVPEGAAEDFGSVLAVGIAAPIIDPETTGCGVVEMSAGLAQLLGAATRICPNDFVALNGRRKADLHYSALAGFREAVEQGNVPHVKAAASQVRAAFRGAEHYLDSFCQKPCHPNGHRLREMLDVAVTESVTPETLQTMRNNISTILR